MDMSAGNLRERRAWHVTAAGLRDPWPKERDRFVFLSALRRALSGRGLQCLGWCLLPDKARLLVETRAEDGLREAMEEAQREYARYWHGWYPPRRRVFRPARAAAVPAALRWDVLADLETEPVRAGLCEEPQEYRWSSAGAHAGWARSYLPLDAEAWSAAWSITEWRERLAQWGADPRQRLEVERLLRAAKPLRRRARGMEPAAAPLFPRLAEAARAAGGWI
jgi:hypothetical protein